MPPVTEDRRRLGVRLTTLQYLISAVFLVLAVSFWVLQVAQHERFQEMAENNHQRTLALRAPRGVVFDRDGKVLVENRRSYSISIVREHTKSIDRTIALLSSVLGLDESNVRAIVERNRGVPAYRPITIVQDATLAQVAAVTARRLDSELPDVVVEQVPTRQYPTESLAAHLFGYVGEATEAQVAASEELKSGDIIGQSGIERTYNDLLMGEDGTRLVVVNSLGREIRTIEEVDPLEGTRLQLTLDADLQRAVEDAFRAYGLNGAAVMLQPATGEVLALASLPAYDPNAFSTGIDRSTWNALNSDTLRPLNDRAIQGRYSPGSTFKMAVAVAALEEGVITPDFRVRCGGSAVFHGRAFRCWRAGGHGSVDLREALEHSCNVYFYTLGNMVGVDRINKWATLLGLGVPTGIDLPSEVTGLVPSTAWKKEVVGEPWYPGETISVAIGQGQVSVTPISLAVMMATLANGGTKVTPHLLKSVDAGDGWKAIDAPAADASTRLSPQTDAAIRDGLWRVVNAAGTGRRAAIPGHDVVGKTGTAQVISLDGGRSAAGRTTRDLRDHGWFVFFAPKDNPQIAGVVFAEHGQSGSAVPIARHALDTFFAKMEGRELPPAPMLVPPVVPEPPAPETAPVLPVDQVAAAQQ
ncbi:MAG: penicillin-binding protein 2 [Vicinamibacterales bacterium]